jgi:hypothetical protein
MADWTVGRKYWYESEYSNGAVMYRLEFLVGGSRVTMRREVRLRWNYQATFWNWHPGTWWVRHRWYTVREELLEPTGVF